MKKILVLGNYKDAMYHPLKKVDDKLSEILAEYELSFTDSPEAFLLLASRNTLRYDAVISYWDDWNNPISQQSADALETYITNGGSLLVIHNGISLALCNNLKIMIGASFITHPTQEEITFMIRKENAKTESDLLIDFSGISEFTLSEEPYQYDMVDDNKKVFLEYIYRGKSYPAGWTKTYGKGKVALLTPGHTDEKFDCPEYIKIIQRTMNWGRS